MGGVGWNSVSHSMGEGLKEKLLWGGVGSEEKTSCWGKGGWGFTGTFTSKIECHREEAVIGN